MISYDAQLAPYISDASCGDFYLVEAVQGGQLVVVGDVGGHGNEQVGEIARFLQTLAHENRQLGIDKLFELVASQPCLNEVGLTLFVGLFSADHPILTYVCVGDLRLYMQRQSKLIPLPLQQGILGMHPPENISSYAQKLQSNDVVFITTDGVANLTRHTLSKVTNSQSLKALNTAIIEQLSIESDDSLSLAILVKLSRSPAISTQAPQPTTPEKTWIHNSRLEQKKIDTEPPENDFAGAIRDTSVNTKMPESSKRAEHNYASQPTQIHPEIVQDALLCTLQNSTQTRQTLAAITHYFKFTTALAVKLQTAILELLHQHCDTVALYVHQEYLKVTFTCAKHAYRQIAQLFGSNAICHYCDQDSYVLNIPIGINVNVASYEYMEFKERSARGLTEQEFQQYKTSKEKDAVLAEQAKISAMGDMVGAIAHQWRQPLNDLAMNIQAIKYRLKGSEDIDATLDEFAQQSLFKIKAMSKNIDDFKNFLRKDNTQQKLKLKDLIQGAITDIQARLNEHHITLVTHIQEGYLIGVHSDFHDILINLLDNAIEALVRSKVEHPYIEINQTLSCICIKDNAGGIDKDVAARIFEPYFTTKNHGERTGLGLYMAKLLVTHKLGGKLTYAPIEDEHGRGSEFCFSWHTQAGNS
ncbi:ATP-binding protein [Pseudoalteromonas sp. SSDWG2]|uniref:ATP-binding protein n=1 Tax=Pseudoalteromonas sp. SSDWG2 TaxID=3139391 RepID=UPI003BADBBFA